LEIMKRVCLLTGASGLLGTEFMRRFAERYHIIAVHHRSPIKFASQDQRFIDPLEPTRLDRRNRSAVVSIRADLRNTEDVKSIVVLAPNVFGPIDLLLNAAAVRACCDLTSQDSARDADQLFRVNVLAPLELASGLASGIWRQDISQNINRRRNIINISSTAGCFIYPDLCQGLYSASKSALNNLTYHMASEYWDIGIRVNCIAPDTFPGRISMAVVLDAIQELDCSEKTGELVVLC
jgi:NAD(P)-dependent dehydrogenase (short-subunit alcohol dehydrogenase family)